MYVSRQARAKKIYEKNKSLSMTRAQHTRGT